MLRVHVVLSVHVCSQAVMRAEGARRVEGARCKCVHRGNKIMVRAEHTNLMTLMKAESGLVSFSELLCVVHFRW